MKFTKHQHTHIIGTGCDPEPMTVDGHTFSFPDYPTVQLFVFKHQAAQLYYVREMRTGLKVGTEYGKKTRAAALADQHAVFERMRNCPKGEGKHAYVATMVEECAARWIAKQQKD
jgi:hypothetical protein